MAMPEDELAALRNVMLRYQGVRRTSSLAAEIQTAAEKAAPSVQWWHFKTEVVYEHGVVGLVKIVPQKTQLSGLTSSE